MKKALVVGINDYPDNELEGCVKDAEAVTTTLEYNGDGTRNFSVKTVKSTADDVTRPILRAAVTDLFRGAPEMALFYFSGHGYMESRGGYLVTSDVAEYEEGVSMEEVLRIANSSKAKNKVIILDCCHAGAFGKPDLDGGNVTSISEGLSILMASAHDETAIEKDGEGVFTSLLIDALQGGAADLRGNITPGSLYAYVDEALGAWDQRPIFKTNVSTFATIREIPPKIPVTTMRKLTEYFEEANSHLQLNPTFEFTEDTAIEENVGVLKILQKFHGVGLVEPVGTDHMYYAATERKTCRLTAMGCQYWRLVKEGRL
ncbi:MULTISPECIES: caspase family protein [unclassified Pseudovibrio]|uniref:caspase family protein n=1 Tax=unclassified Pseudovibrio TaxID=2627060 RepID=UPI0007AE3A41|nr:MULTISPECIES: caspase family protein [unclassified Pseudovibrio]KZL01093.1 Caspase domain protein [Pseudovibrio sp. W74]KZL11158.1 Caspase domain protein [Pseudovibrio sp. Ad14]